MFKLLAFNLAREKSDGDKTRADAFVDQRAEARRPVFREAVLRLEDYYKVQAVITDLSSRGARVEFSTRIDLPSRIVIIEPTLKLKCWARVVWQRDGAAGLEFLPEHALQP